MDAGSEFLRHESCDQCGSSDARSVYDDGHSYCFSCQHFIPGDNSSHTHYNGANVMLQGEAVRLNKRNLEEATCKKLSLIHI